MYGMIFLKLELKCPLVQNSFYILHNLRPKLSKLVQSTVRTKTQKEHAQKHWSIFKISYCVVSPIAQHTFVFSRQTNPKMAEGTYEYECQRAELLGVEKPDYDEWLKTQKEAEAAKVVEEEIDVENLKASWLLCFCEDFWFCFSKTGRGIGQWGI